MGNRRPKSRKVFPLRRAARRKESTPFEAQLLEPRTLLSAALLQPLPDVAHFEGAPADAVDLNNYFTDTSTTVRFDTDLGSMHVVLYDQFVPGSVANFLNYVNANLYDGTIFHSTEQDFVLKGGAFNSSFQHISVGNPIANEPVLSNTRGTIAMDKVSGSADSEASDWFFNLSDNSDPLDTLSGGYTVFGEVPPVDLHVLDDLANVPAFDGSSIGPEFDRLPLANYTPGATITNDNLISLNDVAVLPAGFARSFLNVTVSSDNPSLVSPSVDSTGHLVLTYGAGRVGTASVTVRATDLAQGVAEDTFAVRVDPDPGDVQGDFDIPFPEFTNIADVAVQPDGKFIVVGYREIAGDNDFVVARINADGRGADRSFGGGDGSVTLDVDFKDDRATGVVVQDDGKIVVVGSSGTINDQTGEIDESNFVVARFNPDGSRDQSFGDQGGFTTTDFLGVDNFLRPTADVANDVALQADGKIVVVGQSDSGIDPAITPSKDFAVARYNPDGSLDTGFAGPGAGKTTVDIGAGGEDGGEGVAIQSDGRIVVTGHTFFTGVLSSFATLRFDTAGLLDPSWGGGGFVRTNFDPTASADDEAYSVDIQPDGKVVVGGLAGVLDFVTPGFTANFGLVRYNPDGSLDQSFGVGGGVLTDFGFIEGISKVIVQSDGRIAASGKAAVTLADALSDNLFVVVARYDPNGALDPTFGDGGRTILFRDSGSSGSLLPARSRAALSVASRDFFDAAEGQGDLERQFDEFAQDAQGIIASTRGGAIFAFAGGNGVVKVGVVSGGGAPSVFLVASPVTTAGATSATLILRASDDKAVSAASLNGNSSVLEVVFNGVVLPVTFVSLDNPADAQTLNVRYRVDAPGGAWDQSENGRYVVRLRADQLRDAEGNATPAVEIGGFDVNVPPPPPGPDLVLAALAGLRPGSYLGGGKGGALAAVVRNQGMLPVAAAVAVSFFLSLDQAIDGSDGAPFATVPKVLKLKAGAAKPVKLKFNFPADRPDGNYFVLARVDAANAVPEMNDFNNDASSGVAVNVAKPFVDLSGALGPVGGSFAAGRPGQFVVSVTNGGNIPLKTSALVRLFASTDGTLDGGDVQLNTDKPAKLGLKPGLTKPLRLKFAVPPNLPPGNYFLIVVLDAGNQVGESNETNNLLVSPGQFTVTP